MSEKRLGGQTVRLAAPPSIIASASVTGSKESEGPLGGLFDETSADDYFGEASWEKAESAMLKRCFELCRQKSGLPDGALDYIFSGDLLNQCVGSAYALRDAAAPYFGLYGACSTMAESLSLAALIIDGGFGDNAAALTSSHFCSAERQFRFPLEYGGVRTPTAQWTVTGAGCVILSNKGAGPYVTRVTTGQIVDAGITDINNMGAAMAPADDKIGPYQGNGGASDCAIYTIAIYYIPNSLSYLRILFKTDTKGLCAVVAGSNWFLASVPLLCSRGEVCNDRL